MDFKSLYAKVRPIVQKTRRQYYIKLWEEDDWDQEGMCVLYSLLQQNEGITNDESRLYRYFKVKFRNHVNDTLRKQGSKKRTFNLLHYEEIGEISHRVPSGGLITDELVCLRDSLTRYCSQLTPRELQSYDTLIRGESFKGRKKQLQKLHAYLKKDEDVGSEK
ncbi:sigma-70 family RNA polymerase sigma factor [Streptococcus sp. zg-86]|uniref:Sigma-70 family RNA polymerase sigma factor n=1 Tax=Streptococcus zhangguiae TaxID=2664091 RepID=A0A6I4RKJ1_9STRE|nr:MULTISPECIES: sigma-70 family RNA polymerase sigma factor [unclassified Streptococcus]MTB65136.1 sigma-70 family RNA polymerase sigma factor [Streptococcus sp. zg-86]MTB91396.1 sigma-70 family RNA polymerase sigma factor [Streptococcus sp. zg-36]MWV57123.1 sigma-70 family RNA polymerase sigma factor [Streptococcus sp. zg-70]QTH47865.1 sigma-70 family RNA polymerase sigma factor [Streptococcus sp. zg-86]